MTDYARRQTQADVERRRRRRVLERTHLVGSDVIDTCTECKGPIFRDSRNSHELGSRNVDGSPRHRHVRCPKATR